MSKIKRFFRSKWVFVPAGLLIVGIFYFFFVRDNGNSYQFVSVTRGPIIETISVTGNTKPVKSVSLGFQNTGTIARTFYNLGDRVNAGAVIAELNTANLYAALQQAQANLAIQEANLSELMAGTRPEQITIDQNAVTQSLNALENSITSAYTISDNAIHTSVDQFFVNPRSSKAELSFVVPDAVLVNTVEQERIAIEAMLTEWGTQSSSIQFISLASDQSAENLKQIIVFLNNVASALAKAQPSASVTAANLSSYSSSVSTARTNVTNALSSLTTAETAFISAKDTLALAQAGSTSQDIIAQQAKVAEAQAGVTSAKANLQNALIVAPISGTLTQQDAKIGQQASPNTPLVSIISNNGFEVETGVSDTDIGKLSVGNKVTMTIDAFPNETFTGSVFYIATAETNTQGVINYLVKISFDKPDPRLKSGLTVNATIQTRQNNDTLILPQYAILQNDIGMFVKKIVDGVATTSPVTIGIQDKDGNVEILSGVNEGEEVINIGLK